MTKGLISIIVPTFNGENYIDECLSSIEKQTVPHEVIVVDDLSCDKTVEIARNMGAKVIVNDVHKGQVAGKNTGIRNMNGEFFVTIDQDDRFKPDILKELLKELEESNFPIVFSMLEDFAECEEDKTFCHKAPFRGILTGAAIFKKEVFDKIGLFDESIITGDVIDLSYRCQKNGIDIYNSNLITCERRIHHNNFGRTNAKDEYKDYAKLLRKQFLERIQK